MVGIQKWPTTINITTTWILIVIPKFPILQAKKNTQCQKKTLIIPLVPQHYKEHHATASVLLSLQDLGTSTAIPSTPKSVQSVIFSNHSSNN
jgi:hypothetical protein